MITSEKARLLVAEANDRFDAMLSEGCWTSLTQARNLVEQGGYSPRDVCLCAVAECRNPSPIQDIPDFRHLLESTAGISGNETTGEMKRYFVAVFQQMTKFPPAFAIDPKKSIVPRHPTS